MVFCSACLKEGLEWALRSWDLQDTGSSPQEQRESLLCLLWNVIKSQEDPLLFPVWEYFWGQSQNKSVSITFEIEILLFVWGLLKFLFQLCQSNCLQAYVIRAPAHIRTDTSLSSLYYYHNCLIIAISSLSLKSPTWWDHRGKSWSSIHWQQQE